MPKLNTKESFWARVAVGSPDTCWEWQGTIKNGSRYGKIRWEGYWTGAHRLAAWLTGILPTLRDNTPAKEKLCVLHKCDNPPCCNPKHLFLGTIQDNMTDMKSKKRYSISQNKLSDDQVRKIRFVYKEGVLTQKVLAEQYGVSGVTIFRILAGTRYAGVTDNIGEEQLR